MFGDRLFRFAISSAWIPIQMVLDVPHHYGHLSLVSRYTCFVQSIITELSILITVRIHAHAYTYTLTLTHTRSRFSYVIDILSGFSSWTTNALICI